ncbi:hypothetical protein OGY20_09850 [Citrobacter sp. Cpo114]|uniref:hypothetical protein n=1 Tax=Citrobacter sp. Cpo114 TaxID=2985147 RepID=UPI000ED60011|nr:hypothetical protein [Citrobacter sp. Cpo114]HCM57158.1 hypothetical protein [Citrobacter freundii]
MGKQIKTLKQWIAKSKKLLLALLLLVVVYNLIATVAGWPVIDIGSAFGGVFAVLSALGV